MPTDVRTSELVINKLTKQQYENIPNPDPNQLYLVPEEEEHKPICYPTTASEVTTTSMLVKSSVSDNGKILTENGFVYNTSGNPTISDTKVICELNNGQFETKLTGLAENTQYHIRSYAINSSGLSYGDELVQNTLLNPIPNTYQLVEFINSSGTQYIDTGCIPQLSDRIFLVAAFYSYINFGCANFSSSPYTRCIFGTFNFNGEYVANIVFDTGTTYKPQIPKNYNFNEFELSPTVARLNYMSVPNNNTSYPNLSFYLFKRNVLPTSSSDSIGVASVKYFEITGKRKMYPVYRIADNKPGMYDIVNGVFYTNQGTDEFTVGPDAVWNE